MTDTETADDFYAAHAAGGPSNVVVAHAVHKDGSERVAVFSTLEKAKAWSDTIEEDVVFVPYVIDVPEYGNIPKGERQ